ncbi:MAG: tryptophan synthase subunit alpha [Rhizomicrobium sp.]|jgi:tryptophan synthase alpha chain
MSRIAQRFADLRKNGRAAFVPFITAGDPDRDTSFQILKRLPQAGADLIELGVPFSDPMADGPAIQASSQRALKSGMTLAKVLDMVRAFREGNTATPIILMGYVNPIHAFGIERFVEAAAQAGVDGLITVDLPPEEDQILRNPARTHGLDIIRLSTPTTDDCRLVTILDGASGFLYYVSIAGVTGTKSFSSGEVKAALARFRVRAQIPVVVGFGIKTPEQAAGIAQFADGAVVGSAIVTKIAEAAPAGRQSLVDDVVQYCATLAQSVHAARG